MPLQSYYIQHNFDSICKTITICIFIFQIHYTHKPLINAMMRNN